MITEIINLREVRKSFVVDEGLGERASTFLRSTLDDWQLVELLAPMNIALAELLCWMTAHGTSPQMLCALTWDHSLLFVELRDRGGLTGKLNGEWAGRRLPA